VKQRKMDELLQANAWNGLGNILLLSGEYEQAIKHIEHALELLPSYNYAWADLFDAYASAGELGKPNLKALRNALRNLERTAGDDRRLLRAVEENA
jgi:tetratricopeptide (TPR) repeat protein